MKSSRTKIGTLFDEKSRLCSKQRGKNFKIYWQKYIQYLSIQSWNDFFQCFKIKDESEKPKPSCIPEFSKYLYFMFAPTLVYRDHYPRTTEKKIRWGLVFSHFGEVFGAIVYTYCLFDRYCVPVFRELKVKELDFKSYVHLISVGSLFN